MSTVSTDRSVSRNRTTTSARDLAPNGRGDGVGLDASRNMVRARGPIVTVAGAAAVGVLGVLLIVAPGTLLGTLGFVLVVIAAPIITVTGAPLTSSPLAVLVGVALSAALWFGIGWWAARRACRRAVVGWREFVGELVPLVIGVAVGVGGALLVAALSLGVL